jgi:hypothetical protein
MRSLLFSPSRVRTTVRFLLGAVESILARHGVNGVNLGVVGISLTAAGTLMGCAGVFACPFFRNRIGEPEWLVYVYACAFLSAGFLLLMHWFGICGATGLQR